MEYLKWRDKHGLSENTTLERRRVPVLQQSMLMQFGAGYFLKRARSQDSVQRTEPLRTKFTTKENLWTNTRILGN